MTDATRARTEATQEMRRARRRPGRRSWGPWMPRLRHLLLKGTRPAFWALLRVVPPRQHAVVHGWPTTEGNIVELLPDLIRRYAGTVYWLVDGDPEVAVRHVEQKHLSRVRVIEKSSAKAVWSATTAEVTFFTHGLFSAVVPPADRLVVNLWHGDGPKVTDDASDFRSTVAVTGARMWHRYKADTFRLREEDVAWVGNPRGDALLRGMSPEQWERLGLDPRDLLVVWLPTFRVGRNEEGLLWRDGTPLTSRTDLQELREVAGRPGLSLVVKPHPMDRDDYTRLGIRVLTDADLRQAGVALYELLGCSSAMISDTSSVWVDYLPLGRPVAYFLPDIDELANARGFNVPDLRAILPGPVLRDVGDVRDFLEAVARDGERAVAAYQSHRDRIGTAPLGNTADRLLDWLDEYQRSRGRRPLFSDDGRTPE
jgi:CDP-glycerol glycerophosphotransferase